MNAPVNYRYITGLLIIKFVEVVWTCLDDGDAGATGWATESVLIEHEVDAGKLVTVDVPSKGWPVINKANYIFL